MIHHTIDTVTYSDKVITIIGWAFDEQGAPIEFISNHQLSISRISRYDVQAVFPDVSVATKVGFELCIKRRRFLAKRKLKLVLKGHSDELTLDIPFAQTNIKTEECDTIYEELSYHPIISIVIPVYNTSIQYFTELLDSIKGQTYEGWELCLADGGSSDAGFLQTLSKLPQWDNRIKVLCLGENKGISGNTNEAIKIATGDYIAFCDHDDVLHKDALYEIAKTINEHFDADMIYTDEDKINMDSSQHFQPNRKSDFNMRLLEVGNFLNHLTVVRRSLLEQVGCLRGYFDGSQDYDLVLRTAEKTTNIYHIPKILYHWRCHEASVASSPEAKLYAFDRAVDALQEHFDRIGRNVKVEKGDIYGSYKTTEL